MFSQNRIAAPGDDPLRALNYPGPPIRDLGGLFRGYGRLGNASMDHRDLVQTCRVCPTLFAVRIRIRVVGGRPSDRILDSRISLSANAHRPKPVLLWRVYATLKDGFHCHRRGFFRRLVLRRRPLGLGHERSREPDLHLALRMQHGGAVHVCRQLTQRPGVGPPPDPCRGGSPDGPGVSCRLLSTLIRGYRGVAARRFLCSLS